MTSRGIEQDCRKVFAVQTLGLKFAKSTWWSRKGNLGQRRSILVAAEALLELLTNGRRSTPQLACNTVNPDLMTESFRAKRACFYALKGSEVPEHWPLVGFFYLSLSHGTHYYRVHAKTTG